MRLSDKLDHAANDGLGLASDELGALGGMAKEMEDVIVLIAAEFSSDPMSVQCFDLRIVQRAKDIAREVETS